MPEHNFLLSMGNDGACRVLDYLQVTNDSPDHENLPRCFCTTPAPLATLEWGATHVGPVLFWNRVRSLPNKTMGSLFARPPPMCPLAARWNDAVTTGQHFHDD